MTKIVQVSAIDATMNTGLRELNIQSQKNGYEVYGICSSGPNTSRIKKDKVNLVNVNIDRNIGFPNIVSILRLKKEFENIKPEIVHVHTPVAAVLGRIAAKLAKVPNIIYTAHGFYFHENMSRVKYNVFYFIEKIMAKYFTDFIFTQSKEDADLAVKKNFLPPDKILCIGNGVDVNGKFNPKHIDKVPIEKLYKELKISKSDMIVSFVGRLVKEKGIFELLEAFKKIESSNIKLLIIGDIAQSERDQTTAFKLNKYRHHDNIIFTGRRNDINNLLFISDIFCLPSYREGMPRSIIEAMSMENAVIATNIRGSREEVINGETGFIVPLYDSVSIKEKIDDLIDDKELLRSMQKAGRKRALENYNEQVVVSKQLKVFDEITARRE